jgi:hypothetical protein
MSSAYLEPIRDVLLVITISVTISGGISGWTLGWSGEKTPLSLTKALYRARGKFTLEVFMKKLNVGRIGLLLLVSSLGLSACTPPLPVSLPDAKFRLVHASPDGGNLEIYVDDKRIINASLNYKESYPKDAYTTLSADNHKVEVCPAGEKTGCVSTTAKFDSEKNYTVLLIGTKATTDDAAPTARPLELAAFTDNLASPTKPENARLRVIHAAANTAADKVDVSVQTLTPSVSKVVYKNTQYKNAFDADEIVAGNTQVLVNATDASKSLLIDSGTIATVAGKVYTAIAVNPVSGTSGGVILLTDK